MAELAIRGHATRGKEIIEILEMFGGKNDNHYVFGSNDDLYYYIATDGYIYGSDINYKDFACKYIIFTIEEFLEKYPYKVGDKVQRKGAPPWGSAFEVENMRWDEDTVKYTLCLFGRNDIRSTLPAEHLQPYKEAPMYLNEQANKKAEEIAEILEPVKEIMEGVYAYNEINCYHQDFGDKVRIRLGNDFEIKVEDKITYIVKKQSQYPKTFEECQKILKEDVPPMSEPKLKSDRRKLVHLLEILLTCRDAYWKIAGEQMGLGKSWEPDWKKHNKKYIISVFKDTIIYFEDETYDSNTILAFPTAEMRDAFYENFKELIELCKELL